MREPIAIPKVPTDFAKSPLTLRSGSWFAPFFSVGNRISNALGLTVLRSLRKRWPMAFLLVGAFLTVYVTSEYVSMWHEQHVFAEQWARNSNGSTATSCSRQQESGLARLIIPSIGLEQIVVQGTSYKALKAGPGHLTQTPLPGEPGNAAIAGHRDTYFRRLSDLKYGDAVTIERGGQTYRFVVRQRKIVEPSDTSALRPTARPTLTLITCYPPHFVGPAPERLVVVGELATDSAHEAVKNQSPRDIPARTR